LPFANATGPIWVPCGWKHLRIDSVNGKRVEGVQRLAPESLARHPGRTDMPG
jgi:hypothetical protein